MMGFVEIDLDGVASDQITGENIDRDGSFSRSAVVNAIEPVAAEIIAANPTVVAAAASGVGNAITQQFLARNLVQGPHMRRENLAFLGGSPTFSGPGITGGKLGTNASTPPVPRDLGAYTVEFLFRAATGPSGAAVLVQWAGVYIGLRTSGHPFVSDQSYHSASTAWVCDDSEHHIAVVYTASADNTRVTVNGLYIDGVKRAGDFTGATKQDEAHVNIGGFRSNDAANFYAGRYRNVRISKGARYAANFTPGTIALDASTVFFASFNNTIGADRLYGNSYPPRPVGAPGGSVTYLGKDAPTDAVAPDRWDPR